MDLAAEEAVAVTPALLGFADFCDDLFNRLLQAISWRLEVRPPSKVNLGANGVSCTDGTTGREVEIGKSHRNFRKLAPSTLEAGRQKH